ncbi:MAG: hypothetical protein J6P16_01345 [Eubacterium sp.]|nr:hypothetical protein [Eubacterium sp.]
MNVADSLYEIRRGSICELLTRRETMTGAAQAWMREHPSEYERLYSFQARFVLVMKCLKADDGGDGGILAAMVFDKPMKNSKAIAINGKRHWVRFSDFIAIPREMLILACGKRLDRAGKTISAIYDAHRRAKSRDWHIRQKRLEEEKKFKGGGRCKMK